jgi:uncharacterized protein
MRKHFAGLLAATTLSFALGATALAQTDPTVHQIYEAAASGHLDQAQQMMDQVLRDHPESAKAHYVQSELYAREGKFTLACAELGRAEQLAPGLPKENPRSVAELKSELGLVRRSGGATPLQPLHFPLGTILILILVVGGLWALFHRRRSYAAYPPGYPTGATVPGAPPGPYGAGGYGPGGPVGYGPGGAVGGGIGSTVAGGLAGGLAAGAGFVAGEELAHHLLDGRQSNALPPPADGYGESENRDMGGADFGVNDPASWDDGSGAGADMGGGGGGDDWT